MLKFLAAFSSLLILPLGAAAGIYAVSDKPAHWSRADWSSSGLSPDPAETPEAVVQVFAGRAYRWRGIFAVHTWIVVKPEGAPSYTRFDVTGWGGQPLRVNGYAPDGRWAGRMPDVVFEARGEAAARLIPDILRAVEDYPHADRGGYVLWPGPNSNTFTAWVARRVPGLDLSLPPLAVGKDFAPGWASVMPTPSNTGWQVSLAGYGGAALGVREGIEFHLFGLTIGLDLLRPALKLPGLGRVGLPPAT